LIIKDVEPKPPMAGGVRTKAKAEGVCYSDPDWESVTQSYSARRSCLRISAMTSSQDDNG
jgi:hypothetical protein